MTNVFDVHLVVAHHTTFRKLKLKFNFLECLILAPQLILTLTFLLFIDIAALFYHQAIYSDIHDPLTYCFICRPQCEIVGCDITAWSVLFSCNNTAFFAQNNEHQRLSDKWQN